MKILVLGNIGSGKTTCCKALSNHFPEWDYIAVDDFRRSLSDGTLKGDALAKSAFVKKISHENSPCQIIECSGFGRLGSSVFRRMMKYEGELIVIVLSVGLEECLDRLGKREWDVPFPENTTRGTNLAGKMDKRLASSFLFERWGLRENTIFMKIRHLEKKDTKAIVEIVNALVGDSRPLF